MCNLQKTSQKGRYTGQSKGYKTSFMLNSTNVKSILLINVKMPTNVGILTSISMINTLSVLSVLARKKILFFQYFGFYEQLEFHA